MNIEDIIDAVTVQAIEEAVENTKKHFEHGVGNQHMIMIAFD